MRFRQRGILVVSDDLAQVQKFADRDVEQIIDQFTHAMSVGPFDLAASASLIPLLTVAAGGAGSPFTTAIRHLRLEFTGDGGCDVRLTLNTNTAIPVRPGPQAGAIATLDAYVSATQVFVSNPSTTAAVKVWGWLAGI